MRQVSFIAVLIGLFLASCSSDTVTPAIDECEGTSVTYTVDVKPILDTHCATAGCHNTGTRAKGLDYSTYTSAKAKAGDRNFLGSVRHESGFDAMPQGGSKLSDAQIMSLACWVANGFPE